MKKFYLAPKNNAPEITLDEESETYEIKGRSLPENTDYVYMPVIEWLEQFKKHSQRKPMVFQFKLLYLNTASKKMLHEIFVKLEQIHLQNNNVTINWYFETNDTDILECGEEFCSLINLPYKLIEIQEE